MVAFLVSTYVALCAVFAFFMWTVHRDDDVGYD